jgi:hypothetical protein
VKAAELLELLLEFYYDKLALRQRHVAAAKHVPNYDFNNTYQYIIAREDLQLSWLRDAITDLGGALPVVPEPELRVEDKGDAVQAAVISEDRDRAQAFLDKWTRRVEAVNHARHRNMLRVILGETIEHKRFFDQALAGRTDLLGRRADGAGTKGAVLDTRWVE